MYWQPAPTGSRHIEEQKHINDQTSARKVRRLLLALQTRDLNNQRVKPCCLSSVSAASAVLLLSLQGGESNLGFSRPWDSQPGRSGTERNSQPYIWIRSTGWALMASLWNLKHRHRPESSSWGKSEYQQPFRSACTCLLHVTAPFSSPALAAGRRGVFTKVIYSLCIMYWM